MRHRIELGIAIAGLLVTACAPKVSIVPPSEPIVINMNIKIEHEITIRVDKELDDLFLDDELFGESES
jgi:hypothetical protein